MRIEVSSSNNEDLSMVISGENNKDKRAWCSREVFRSVLDHAWLNRQDVNYNPSDKILTIKLRRHDEKSKARKKFLGGTWWVNTIPPNRQCSLIIKDIESCEVCDKYPFRKEVIIGGITLNDQEIYIDPCCEYEEGYSIKLRVKRINVILEDIAEKG